MRTLEQWKALLIHLATEYDEKQRIKGKGWNMFALGMFFENINAAVAEPYFLENPKKALMQHFIIRGETGGIYHRNLPEDLTDVKFVLSFLNNSKLWK